MFLNCASAFEKGPNPQRAGKLLPPLFELEKGGLKFCLLGKGDGKERLRFERAAEERGQDQDRPDLPSSHVCVMARPLGGLSGQGFIRPPFPGLCS